MPYSMLGVKRAIACALVGALASWIAGPAAIADGTQQPKAWITVEGKELSLLWNADQGEAGRGRGEVFLTVWVYWPSAVECTNPQHVEFGPLGGDDEFPSGTLVETPPGSGNWSITPATEPVIGQIYHCEANCPVAHYLEVYVYVWESDSNKELNDYVKTIKDAVDSAAKDAGDQIKGLSFIEVVTAGVQVLIDLLTKSSDDSIGRFSGIVEIPDPCTSVFSVEREVSLENLSAALWKDVHAEAEDGTAYEDPPYGLQRPATIGTLKLKILGGPCVNKFCSFATTTSGDQTSHSLDGFDIGQPDEASIVAWMETQASIPTAPDGATYRVAYDTDNSLATGCPFPGLNGAEYVAVASVAADGSCTAQLLHWNPPTSSLVPVPGGIDDAAFDIDRQAVLISVLRSQLGLSTGTLAARASVALGGLNPVSQLPVQGQAALTIPVNAQPTQVLPTVVGSTPTADGIDVPSDQPITLLFSKSMNRQQTAVATHLLPPVPATSVWTGNRLTLLPKSPLAPDAPYQLVVEPFATDTVGTPFDGNNDLVPGDPFVLPFRTMPLPVTLTNAQGDQAGAFAEGEPILMTFEAPPKLPADARAYVVPHLRRGLAAGEALVDASSDGPDPINGDDVTVALGSVGTEGEYHVVLDLDGDGAYTPPVDRIDRNHIGFAVLPDCNGDGVIDAVEIAAGVLVDSDGDGKPDICEAPPCPADLNGDGTVDGADLAILLGSWGPCGGCPADLVTDGAVDGADLAIVLGSWGACP